MIIDSSEIGLDFLLNESEATESLSFNIQLYVLDNYSHKDIAKMLHISEGTSKSNLSRARKILKSKLKITQTPKKISKCLIKII